VTGLKICLNIFPEACESIVRFNELCVSNTHMCNDVSSKMFVFFISSTKTAGSFGAFVPCLLNYTLLGLFPGGA